MWCIQTPQVFETALIRHAYFKLMENEENETGITDDAMVVERMENCAVKLVEGSYENIKITTPRRSDISRKSDQKKKLKKFKKKC